MTPLDAKDVQWIVNKGGELGVKIHDQFFFLYKGESLVYDPDSLNHWAPVRKREFGECCISPEFESDCGLFLERQWKPIAPMSEVAKTMEAALRAMEANDLGHLPEADRLREMVRITP